MSQPDSNIPDIWDQEVHAKGGRESKQSSKLSSLTFHSTSTTPRQSELYLEMVGKFIESSDPALLGKQIKKINEYFNDKIAKQNSLSRGFAESKGPESAQVLQSNRKALKFRKLRDSWTAELDQIMLRIEKQINDETIEIDDSILGEEDNEGSVFKGFPTTDTDSQLKETQKWVNSIKIKDAEPQPTPTFETVVTQVGSVDTATSQHVDTDQTYYSVPLSTEIESANVSKQLGINQNQTEQQNENITEDVVPEQIPILTSYSAEAVDTFVKNMKAAKPSLASSEDSQPNVDDIPTDDLDPNKNSSQDINLNSVNPEQTHISENNTEDLQNRFERLSAEPTRVNKALSEPINPLNITADQTLSGTEIIGQFDNIALKNDNRKLMEKLREFETVLEDKSKIIEKIDCALKTSIAKGRGVEKKYEQLYKGSFETQTNLIKRIQHLEEEIIHLREERDSHANELFKSRKMLKEITDNSQKGVCSAEQTRMKHDLEQMKKQIDHITGINNSLQEQVRSKTRELNEAQQLNKELMAQQTKGSSAELTQIKSEKQTLEAENQLLRIEMKNLTANRSQFESNLFEDKLQLVKETTVLKSEIDKLADKLHEQEEKNAKLSENG